MSNKKYLFLILLAFTFVVLFFNLFHNHSPLEEGENCPVHDFVMAITTAAIVPPFLEKLFILLLILFSLLISNTHKFKFYKNYSYQKRDPPIVLNII